MKPRASEIDPLLLRCQLAVVLQHLGLRKGGGLRGLGLQCQRLHVWSWDACGSRKGGWGCPRLNSQNFLDPGLSTLTPRIGRTWPLPGGGDNLRSPTRGRERVPPSPLRGAPEGCDPLRAAASGRPAVPVPCPSRRRLAARREPKVRGSGKGGGIGKGGGGHSLPNFANRNVRKNCQAM